MGVAVISVAEPIGYHVFANLSLILMKPYGMTVKKVNEVLDDEPGLLNSSPYDEGWLFEIEMSDSNEVSTLLTPQDYEKTL